ncbi:MAG: hypothetical protein LC720_05630 [Actinobacteria bacterium]|nr:hypothetical protein [Actinomycetota bacterium]
MLTKALALMAVATLALVSTAAAVAPRGDANFVATDSQGRPAITIWMQTKTNMVIFVCYRWGKVDHGNHLNNSNPIHVPSSGSFSYHGPAYDLHQRTSTIQFSGRFVTRDRAEGTMTAPCMKHRHFTANLAR